MRFHVKHLVAALLVFMAAPCAASGDPVSFPGDGVTLVGRLYRPAGPGPFPAVVMQHGCSGLWGRDREPTASYRFWAEHFRDRGFVALLVDSFGPRGQREICTQKNRTISVTRDRPADAYAARRYLATRPDVQPGAIDLMGWSNGAMSVLNAVSRVPEGQRAFRRVVAFYPGCHDLLNRPFEPSAPLLILSGEADDWTPARHCVELARRARGDQPVRIEVYPGAHHAFDRVDGKIRFRPEVRNASSPTGWGATVGPQPEARARSIEQATSFLAGSR